MPSLYIDREECIGDSLVKLNNNFTGHDADIVNLDTKINSASASAITLTTNLSSNIQNNSPFAAKAWCWCDPAGNIISAYNVVSVSRPAVGSYTFNFTPGALKSTPIVIASCSQIGDGGPGVQNNSVNSVNVFLKSYGNNGVNAYVNMVAFCN